MAYCRNVILALTLFLTASSGNAQWQRLPTPFGGTVNEIVAGSGAIYAAEGDYGAGDLYKSTDLGASWFSIGESLPSHPFVLHLLHTGNELYAGTSQGLYITTNEGASWKLAADTILHHRVTCLNVINGTVYFGTQGLGLLRRNSAGIISGSNLASNAGNGSHAIIGVGTSIYVATNGNGVYRSDDDGATWQKKSDGFTAEDNYVFSLASLGDTLLAGTLHTIYRSTDRGEHWVPFGSGLAGSSWVEAIAVTNSEVYVNTTSAGIYRLLRGDTLWHVVENSIPPTYYTHGLLISNGYLFHGSQRYGIYRRAIGDTSAGLHSTGITSLSIVGLRLGKTATGSDVLFAGTLDADFGLGWRSTDRGSTWSIMDISNRGIHDFVQTGDSVLAGTDGEGIALSTNNGEQWQAPVVPGPGFGYVTKFCRTKTTIIAIASGFGLPLSYSTNGGQDWLSSSGQSSTPVNDIFYDSIAEYSFAPTALGLLRSTNDGRSWSEITGAIAGKNVQFITYTQNKLWLSGFDGIYCSSDHGDTWSQTTIPNIKGRVTAMYGHGDLLALATDSGAYISTSPTVWKEIDGLPAGIKVISLVADDAYLYAGSDGLGLWRTALPNSADVSSHTTPLPITVRGTDLILPDDTQLIAMYDVIGRPVWRDSRNLLGATDLSHLKDGHYCLQYTLNGATIAASILLHHGRIFMNR